MQQWSAVVEQVLPDSLHWWKLDQYYSGQLTHLFLCSPVMRQSSLIWLYSSSRDWLTAHSVASSPLLSVSRGPPGHCATPKNFSHLHQSLSSPEEKQCTVVSYYTCNGRSNFNHCSCGQKEEVLDHVQWKKYLTSLEEAVDHLQGKKSRPPAMQEVVDQLQWKK